MLRTIEARGADEIPHVGGRVCFLFGGTAQIESNAIYMPLHLNQLHAALVTPVCGLLRADLFYRQGNRLLRGGREGQQLPRPQPINPERRRWQSRSACVCSLRRGVGDTNVVRRVQKTSLLVTGLMLFKKDFYQKLFLW